MDDIENSVASRTPMGRMAYPVDIARMVGFLASEDAGWMSGESFLFFSSVFIMASGSKLTDDKGNT